MTDAIVLYVDFLKGRRFVGVFCKLYPCREIMVFVDDRTERFAKPGAGIQVTFSKFFDECDPSIVVEPNIVTLQTGPKRPQFKFSHKDQQQAIFFEHAFFAKDKSEDDRSRSDMVYEVALAEHFGPVVLLKKFAKGIELDKTKAYLVKIARPPRRLAQSVIDDLGGYMFCIGVVEEVTDPKVFVKLNGLHRSMVGLPIPDHLRSDVMYHKESTYPPVESLILFALASKECGIEFYNPHENKCSLIETPCKVVLGTLYCVIKDDEDEDDFVQLFELNNFVRPYGKTYEVEISGEVQELSSDEESPFDAFIESPFGKIVFINAPEIGFHDMVVVRAIFCYEEGIDFSWFAHSICKLEATSFTMLEYFTESVAILMEKYDTLTNFPSEVVAKFTVDASNIEDASAVSDRNPAENMVEPKQAVDSQSEFMEDKQSETVVLNASNINHEQHHSISRNDSAVNHRASSNSTGSEDVPYVKCEVVASSSSSERDAPSESRSRPSYKSHTRFRTRPVMHTTKRGSKSEDDDDLSFSSCDEMHEGPRLLNAKRVEDNDLDDVFAVEDLLQSSERQLQSENDTSPNTEDSYSRISQVHDVEDRLSSYNNNSPREVDDKNLREHLLKAVPQNTVNYENPFSLDCFGRDVYNDAFCGSQPSSENGNDSSHGYSGVDSYDSATVYRMPSQSLSSQNSEFEVQVVSEHDFNSDDY